MFIEELELELTRDCTLNVDSIYRGEVQRSSMNLETIDNIFEYIETIGTLKLRGGEPLMAVAQLEKIIKLIIKKGIKVGNITLVTNGTIISERICVILKKLGFIAGKDFHFIISSDICNFDALKSAGLLKRKIHNTAIFKEYFGATEMEFMDDTAKVGLFLKNGLNNDGKKENRNVCLVDNTMEGSLTFDVYGNIVSSGLSYAEEDKQSKEIGLNVNKMSLTEAVNRYMDYEERKLSGNKACLKKAI